MPASLLTLAQSIQLVWTIPHEHPPDSEAPDVGTDAFVRAWLHLKSAPGVGTDACARARLAAPFLH